MGVLEKRHPRFHGGDAPEARRGGLLDPHATEVYMCGAALLRLLSPADAHPSRKPARVCHADDGTRTLVLPADRLQHAPAGAVELLRGMLAHAPEHRWRLQDILSHEYVAGAPDRLPVALVVAAAAVGRTAAAAADPWGVRWIGRGNSCMRGPWRHATCGCGTAVDRRRSSGRDSAGRPSPHAIAWVLLLWLGQCAYVQRVWALSKATQLDVPEVDIEIIE